MMKPRIVFSENALKVQSERWPFLLCTSCALLFFLLALAGFLELLPLMNVSGHIFLGLGLLCGSGGVLLLALQKTVTLTVNSSRGVLEVKNLSPGRQSVAAFPLSYFSRIIIRKQIIPAGKSRVATTFPVSLESHTNSYLRLFEFGSREEAGKFVEQLREILLLDVYHFDKLYKKADFNLKSDHAPEEIALSDQSDLTVLQKESEIVVKWKKRHRLLFALCWLTLGYGLCHILLWGIFPDLQIGPQDLTGLFSLGAVVLGVGLILLQRATTVSILRLGCESIIFFKKILGFKVRKQQMYWDDVAELCNTLGGRKFIILSHTGSELGLELAEQEHQQEPNEEFIAKLQAGQAEKFYFDFHSLEISDRVRVEQEILKFML